MDAYVARQPIFDAKKNLFAYELLFRDGFSNFMPQIDGDIATSKLLSSSFFTIGIDNITNGKRAFINFTQNLLIKEAPLLLPKEIIVVEILEDVKPDKEVIESCKHISQKGYMLALDDFVFDQSLTALIDLSDIIKIDFRLTPIEEIKELIGKIENRRIKLLAEKVETYEEFQKAKELGFEYFQGYFFKKPEILKGKEISGNKMILFQIISEVNKSNFDFNKIERMIVKDLSLSYKLLRYINSAFFKLRAEIDTIKKAMTLLGEKEIRRFVSLIAMSKLASGKPDELMRSSCIKARFCESLGRISSCMETPEELFTTGLFSNIDAILDQPIDEIVKNLPLSKNICHALLGGKGKLSDFLKLSEYYANGNWDLVKKLSSELCVLEEKIPPIYLEACEWSNALFV